MEVAYIKRIQTKGNYDQKDETTYIFYLNIYIYILIIQREFFLET